MTVQKQRNEVLRLLDPMKKHHYFKEQFNSGNSWLHEHRKFEEAWNHAVEGHDVLLEASFKGYGRADVVCLDCRLIIEVVSSEKEESILTKQRLYPDLFQIQVVRT